MRIEKFEDIIAWQKARELAVEIFKNFKDNRNYSFRDQIQRAAVSVMNNIAEGFERHTNKEFINFLYIAKGSSAEVRSMIYLAYRLNYMNREQCRKCYNLTIDTSRLISGFIKIL